MPFTLSAPSVTTPAIAIIWLGDNLLLTDQQLPALSSALPLPGIRPIGDFDGQPVVTGSLVGEPPPGALWVPLRQAFSLLADEWAPALVRARQLHRFDREHRFCSVCAHPLDNHPHDSGKGCPSCGAAYYPKLAPAMMVVVTRGRELLLARAPHFPADMYSALAGFVEAGETLEACVHREVMEEVGLRIGNLRYAGSQSWPFPHSLMLAFIADYHSGDIVPQEGEIADAQWFAVDRLPAIPARHSIAHWLIGQAVAGIPR